MLVAKMGQHVATLVGLYGAEDISLVGDTHADGIDACDEHSDNMQAQRGDCASSS